MRKKRRRKLSLIFGLVILIIILNISSSLARNFFWKNIERITSFFLEKTKPITNLFSLFTLLEENHALTQENEFLLSQLGELEGLREENQFLRQALGLKLKEEFKLSLARVRGGDLGAGFFIVDKGKKDGITSGQPIINNNKVLVGKIENVYEDFSRAVFIFYPQNKISAKIINKNVLGIIRVNPKKEMVMEIPSSPQDIEVGDLVVTTGKGSIYPPGLLIGKIEDIEKIDTSPFLKARISPLFDPAQTEMVFIILERYGSE